MASRNERKRLAKAKRIALERAVNEAFALEAERNATREALEARLRENPFYEALPKSSNGALIQRTGAIVKGKFERREPQPYAPLAHDGNASGRGQLRKRWTK